MPTNTPRLGIPKPLGNETVSRAAFNTIYDTIDTNAATRKEPEILAADIFASGFVLSGMIASKNATKANQLDVAAGACYVQQVDGGLRRFTPAAASFITSVALATYYLDFQPDGTYSWGTVHSTQAGYLPIAEVTTDAAKDIATVTDKRPLVPGVGKVNADLVRGRNLAAEHDAHLADNAAHNIPSHFDPTTGHKHSGAAGDAPPVPWNNVSGKPSTFPPSAHKSTHATGGADALAPADIGAVNKAGDTMTGNLTLSLDNPKIIFQDVLKAALMTEVDAQLLDFGVNYSQAGIRDATKDGGLFRIDVRPGYPLFNVLYQPAGGSERVLFCVDKDGQIYQGNKTYKVWHAGNDGAGSGLDADTVDGLHSSSLTALAFGHYIGDGATSRTINTGFTPQLVFISTFGRVSGAAQAEILIGAVNPYNIPCASIGDTANNATSVSAAEQGSTTNGFRSKIISGGFIVQWSSPAVGMNANGVTYVWIALGRM